MSIILAGIADAISSFSKAKCIDKILITVYLASYNEVIVRSISVYQTNSLWYEILCRYLSKLNRSLANKGKKIWCVL